MSTQTLNISLPQELVAEIDTRATRDYASRSEYIRRAIVNQIRTERNVQVVLDRANARGHQMGITSEQQVYDLIGG